MSTPARVLLVTTSTPTYEKVGYRTGLWLGELTHFWDVLEEEGHEMVIASVSGGRVPIDPESLGKAVLAMGGTKDRYEDASFMALLEDTQSLSQVVDDEWDAVYLTGGHGTMFDFPHNPVLGDILVTTFEKGGIVSAVCHGPAGLLGATLEDGTPLVAGRKVTGFSWPEEKLANRDGAVPFRLDEALEDEGAKYVKALRPMAQKVVRDGNLITGQNPTSAAAVGKQVAKRLARRKNAPRD